MTGSVQVTRHVDVTRRNARGNPGITVTEHFSNLHRTGSHFVGLSVSHHQPDQGCDMHNHRGADEIFLVQHGYGVIAVGNKDYPFSPDGFTVLCVLVRAPGHESDDTPWLSTDA